MKNIEIKAIIDQEIASRSFLSGPNARIEFGITTHRNSVGIRAFYHFYEVSCVHPNGGHGVNQVGFGLTVHGVQGADRIRRKVSEYLDDLVARGYGVRESA